MKLFGIVLLACVALSHAQTVTTVGDVAANICPEAATALQANTILSAAIEAVKDVEVTIPEGQAPVIVAPSDAAFEALLAELGLTPEELLADTETLTSVLALHLASTDGPTLAGPPFDFTAGGAPVDLAGLIAADGVDSTVSVDGSTADIEGVIECPKGATILSVGSVLLPAAAPGPADAPTPAPAPAPTPSGPITTTYAGLLDLLCPDIAAVLTSPDYSILNDLLNLEGVADAEITIPEGSLILAGPTNAAFQKLLPLLPPGATTNATIVAMVLQNHIAVTQNVASDAPATTLLGEDLQFWRLMPGGPPMKASAAFVAANQNGTAITTDDITNIAVVGPVVACPADNQWAFSVGSVLLPKGLKPAPAPTPAPAPAPTPLPPKPVLPPPAPVSGAAGVRAAVAAVAVAAAALMA